MIRFDSKPVSTRMGMTRLKKDGHCRAVADVADVVDADHVDSGSCSSMKRP